eukprot:TRINITY_DN6500_c0_g1_i2.p1 TRINITY_DN6500_c0_g1~~TRINITY_DN6500_c0_g1_i2.p1  ORF type:complete len:947 (-),score=247.18 TRINITY_DN6500_c0_g1_i2:91-2931(-)
MSNTATAPRQIPTRPNVDTNARIANLTPEERQALQARILARREQQAKASGNAATPSATTPNPVTTRPIATSANTAVNRPMPAPSYPTPAPTNTNPTTGNRPMPAPSYPTPAPTNTTPTTVNRPMPAPSYPTPAPTASPASTQRTQITSRAANSPARPAAPLPSETPVPVTATNTANVNAAVNDALNKSKLVGARGALYNSASANPASGSNPSPSPGTLRGLPTRRVVEPLQRRPSIQVIEKEKKTDYWKDVAQAAQSTGQVSQIAPDDLNTVISRAMSLGIVGDRKQRQSVSAPKAQDVLLQVYQSMEKRVLELNGKIPEMGNMSIMDKISTLEKILSVLEIQRAKQEEEEKLRVQKKIVELESSLKTLEAQKTQQRESKRETMKIEIDKLKEMMATVQAQQNPTADVASKDMASKMARMEAALRLMNEEKKKETEDKETVLLKRKLQLFEQKLREMEDEKKLRDEADNSQALREKLLAMEDKLSKMERRKSVSMTQEMQVKMEAVEKQMQMLRAEKSNGHSDAVNTKIAQKMALLERQLKEMAVAKQNIVVNDPETQALRTHISKLEETILVTEKRLEQQRTKMEEERIRIYEQKRAEDEEFRRKAAEKERELLKRLDHMEQMMKNGPPPAPAGQKATNNDFIAQKMAEMEKKILETQKALEEERNKSQFLSAGGLAPSGGAPADPNLDPIAFLAKAQAELAARLKTTEDIMNKKMEELSKMQFVGTPGGGSVSKSGLSFKEINEKLAEIQSKLFSGDIDERESETLNIEYEKLITELEQTDEYKKEQEETRDKWKRENEAPNREAFEKVTALLKTMEDAKLTAAFKRKPELRFLLKTPEQLLKAHVNDFKQVSTQNLNLLESRALYHNMPAFRKDQEQQAQFVVQLQAKIEQEMAKPQVAAPPPIQPKKTVVIKKKAAGGGGGGGGGGAGGFLDELLAKRKRKE